MVDLQIIVDGSNADSAAETLSGILMEGESGTAAIQKAPPALPNVDRKAIDPLSLAALVLSIPGTVLAVMDIADRMQKRRKAQALIEAAKRLQDEKRAQAFIVLLDGTPRALDQLTADNLLEIAEKQNQAD